MQNTVSCYYHPTTVMLVDDNQPFLDSIRLGLNEKLSYQIYSDPFSALEFVGEQAHIDTTQQRAITGLTVQELENAGQRQSVNIDINAIHQAIYHRHRFDELSVVLVDYAMPCMTGIEFCSQLQHHPVKKILVTGQASAAIAIDAFNQGIIDQFIVKSSPSFFEQVNHAIHNLQTAYFRQQSQFILTSLMANPESALGCPAFEAFFNGFIQDHDYAEYYLVDTTGSFLFLDFAGTPTWLMVKSRQENQRYAQLACQYGADNALCSALASAQQIPFFFTHQAHRLSVDEWPRYCHTANAIPGCDDHFYAIYTPSTPSLYDIYPEEIASYENHCMQLQPV